MTKPTGFIENHTASQQSYLPSVDANVYPYLNTIRFFSMFAIVFEHSFLLPNSERSSVEQFLMQFFKFGTIGFFLVSGFLIGVRRDYESKQKKYFFSRIRSVFLPWLTFSILLISLRIISILIKMESFDTIMIFDQISLVIKDVVFHTAYWFVPSYLITLLILNFILRLQSRSLSTFIVISILAFFTSNIYLNIVPSSHTTSIVAFLPILWFGYYIGKNQVQFLSLIKRVGIKKLYIFGVIALILQMVETGFINAIGVGDPFNTLRLSNLIYGVIIFCLFANPDNSIRLPSFLNPRQFTFGIYLTHTLIGVIFSSIFKRLGITDSLPSFYLLMIFFPLLYSMSTLVTVFLHRTKLKFILGG